MRDHWLEAYGRWVVAQRMTLTAIIMGLNMLAAWAIFERLQTDTVVDFTPQAMFMGEGGVWERLQSYEDEFGAEDNTLIAMMVGDFSAPEGLKWIRAVHAAVEDTPGVVATRSVANASIAVADEAGLIAVQDAVDDDSILARAAQDPFIAPVLIAPDLTAATVQVDLDEDLQQISDLSPVVHEVTSRLKSVKPPRGFELHVTGVPFVRTEVVDMMVEDELTFMPLVTLVFLVTILVLLRRVWLGLAPLIGVLFATIQTVGLLMSQGAVFNILSILAPTLILVIGVADGIHLVNRYREELARDGDKSAAMGRTTRHMSLPCFLTTFTTAAGFASLMVADTVVIRDFGQQVAIGVLITFVAVMLVVPTLLAWIPVARVGNPGRVAETPYYGRLADVVLAHPRRILAITLTLTLFVGWLGRDVRTNSGILEMYHEDHPTWSAVVTTQEKSGGVIPIFIHLAGEPGQMLEPEVLRGIGALERHLSDLPMVGFTTSPASWIAHLHHILTGERGWPDSREAAAQELLLAEMSGDLPIGSILSSDRGRARILALTTDAGGREFLRARAELEATARTLFAGTGIVAEVTGDGMLAADGVDKLITDLLKSLVLMLGVILATMMVLLRDVRQTLVATLPNLVPLVFILGTLGIIGADLQTSNIVSFTIAVGLAVDDTIHFIMRYREERRSGVGVDEAIRRTFRGAGHAIVLTSILLILGFGVLTFSQLTSTYFFGLLACVTMTAALLGDLMILPALLKLTEHTSAQKCRPTPPQKG